MEKDSTNATSTDNTAAPLRLPFLVVEPTDRASSSGVRLYAVRRAHEHTSARSGFEDVVDTFEPQSATFFVRTCTYVTRNLLSSGGMNVVFVLRGIGRWSEVLLATHEDDGYIRSTY
jgi:hypothetical protein